ncbi:MAG: DUF3732 domain-containing protein [Nitrosarchaeum sp.]|nr:DUF3732 domain-containing protein [Nitrosarchaeum sp.]
MGVIIKINEKKVFIARKNVEYLTTTDPMYFEYWTENSGKEQPETTNTNRHQIIDFLSSELDIEKIPFEFKDGEESYLNVRHTSFFCYLTQNEIDATDSLYHRAHDGFLNIQIKSALEYFLGTFNEDLYYDFIKLQKLRKELATINSKLKEFELIKGEVFEKAYELLGKCQRFGLYSEKELPNDTNEYITMLNRIISSWKPEEITLHSGSVVELYDQLIELREKLAKKEEDLYEIKKYSNATKTFKEETDHQKYRLNLIDVFDSDKRNNTCPLCENDLKHIPIKIEEIKNDFIKIDNELGGTKKIRHYVEEIVESVEKEIIDIKNDISKISSKIKGFLGEEKISENIFKENLQISEIIGEVKLWLESVRETDDKSKLSTEKKLIINKIKSIENNIKFNEQSPRRINILDSINEKLDEWAPELQLYQARKIKFKYSIDKMEIILNDKQRDYSNLGGGHNMLAIHVMLYLALHRHFIERERPVPNFIIFDQPSTPYFSEDPDVNNINDYYEKDPRKKLGRMYKFIIDKTNQMKNLQVIIVDQANLTHEAWFEKYEVKDWNGALLPNTWKEE